MRSCRVLVAILAVAAVATSAFAADSRFIGDNTVPNANVLWNAPTSWADLDEDGTGDVPVDGNRIVLDDDYCFNGNWGIDVAGAALNLPASGMGFGYGGRNWSFYDSATLTPSNNPLANPTDFDLGAFASLADASAASTQVLTVGSMNWDKSGTPRFFIPVAVTGTFKNPENGLIEFYGPATIGVDDVPRGDGWTADLKYYNAATITTKNVAYRSDGNDEETWFYGVTNIGTVNQDGGKIYMMPTATGTIDTLNFSRGTLEAGAVTINNLNWTGGTLVVDGLPDPTVVPANAVLKVNGTPAVWPSVTVQQGGTLIADMTNADYSTGITFEDDAVLAEIAAPTAGPLTTAHLAPGVSLWRGVLNTQDSSDYYEVGENGTNPYKGVAINPSYSQTGEWRATFKAAPASGDLYFKIEDRKFGNSYNDGPNFYGDSSAIGEADNTSSTAHFFCNDNGGFNIRRHLNLFSQGDADRILTFNFYRQPGKERTDLFTANDQAGIYADQTINVEGGKFRLSGSSWKLEGALGLTNVSWNMDGQAYDAIDDPGTLTLSGRTTLDLPDASNTHTYEFLEGLEDRLTYSGMPTVLFNSRNGGPHIYDFDFDSEGISPVLAGLLANSDYGSNHYHTINIGSGGLVIGDGKFLSSAGACNETSQYVAHDTGLGLGVIRPAVADGTIGIAAMTKDLTINMAVVAPNGTLQIGTDDPNRLLTAEDANGGFVTAIPTKRVTFGQGVDVAALNIVSGQARINMDLTTIPSINVGVGTELQIPSGNSLMVTDTLGGEGVLSGGGTIVLETGATIAPGASAGTLTATTPIALEDGVIYALEIADTAGVAGVSSDLVWGTDFDFDVDDDLDGALTVKINAAGSSAVAIGDADAFVLFATNDGGFEMPDIWTISYDAIGLDMSAAELTYMEDYADVNNDGSNDDCIVLVGMVGAAQPGTTGGMMGDANGDSLVDDNDLSLLLANWGRTVGWAKGEFSGDDLVNDNDLSLLLANWTGSSSPAMTAVPEPTSLAMLALGALAVMRRRRK